MAEKLPLNFGKEWSNDELNVLYKDIGAGKMVGEIARSHFRTEGEVIRKMRDLAVNLFIDGFMSKDGICTATALTMDQLDVAIREYQMNKTRDGVKVMRTISELQPPVSGRTAPIPSDNEDGRSWDIPAVHTVPAAPAVPAAGVYPPPNHQPGELITLTQEISDSLREMVGLLRIIAAKN